MLQAYPLFGTGERRMGQGGFIGEAESAVNRIGCCAHLKPLEQGLGLRMVGEFPSIIPDGDRHHGGRKYFYRISGFQVALAYFGSGWHSRELP